MDSPAPLEPLSSFCPVPPEQQPLQEYEDLQAAWLFNWAVQPWVVYGRKLAWVAFWSGLLLSPLAWASFPWSKAPIQFTLTTLSAAVGMMMLLVLRLYSGWGYIRDRLERETVTYEESGWYDGQTWIKPPEVWARDRLVATYQVQPVLGRLRRTLAGGILLLGLNVLIWWLIA
ncbi:MAG: CGLD27 family protein [Cyanobacteria bacterium P01_G01_bin.54]